MAVDLNPNENVGQWLEIIGKDGTKGYRNAQTGAQITPQQFGELVAAAKNAVQSKMLDPLGPFGKPIHPSVKQLAEIDTKRIPGYKPETQVLMDAPMLPGVGAGMRALAGAAQRALPSQAAQRALPNPGNVAEVIGAPTFRESFRAQQAAGRVGPRAPFREADVVGPSQLRSPVANPQLPSSTASPQLPAPSSVLPNAPWYFNIGFQNLNSHGAVKGIQKVGVPPSFAAGAAGMTMAANAAQQFANNQNAAQVPVANPAEFVRNWSDPELNPTLLSFMSKVGTPSNWSDPELNPTLLSFMSKVGTPSNTASKGQNAPKGRQAQRLEGMRALTQAVSQGAAEQPGAPAPTDTSVVPNTPSGRPDYKYYADMLNAADSNDSYYRDFLNLRNQARAAAREAAASNMRYQFVPIRDDRANRIYFVNADGSDVVLDMGKPEDVREYRRVAEKIGVDINHLSDWMDRSSKPLARYNMPPGSNVDTTPDFGFWRKLPSTKAEGAEPAMDTPSTPTNLGLSLGERNLPRSAKMPSPQSTLETMQRMRDLRMPLGGFPAAQTPEPATPVAPAPSAPVAQTKQAEPVKSAEEQGTKMQQPAVAAVAPQSQQFTPRAAAAPRPAGESTRMLYNNEEPLPDWLSNLSVAQNVIGESIFKGLRKDSMYKDIPVSKPNVRHLESDLPAEPPLPPVEQGQVGAPVVLTPSNMPRVNPEDEDMSRFRQYRNFIPR